MYSLILIELEKDVRDGKRGSGKGMDKSKQT